MPSTGCHRQCTPVAMLSDALSWRGFMRFHHFEPCVSLLYRIGFSTTATSSCLVRTGGSMYVCTKTRLKALTPSKWFSHARGGLRCLGTTYIVHSMTSASDFHA